MAQMYQPSPESAERDARLRELVAAATARYNDLSPREKEMHDWAQRISWVYGEMGIEYTEHRVRRTKEQIAEHLLTTAVGPEYAATLLADPEFRRIADLLPHD